MTTYVARTADTRGWWVAFHKARLARFVELHRQQEHEAVTDGVWLMRLSICSAYSDLKALGAEDEARRLLPPLWARS